MLRQAPQQLSLYSILYNKIPKNHILKRIKSVIDFSFINNLLADSYCLRYGRPAKEPEMMCKLLFLQYLYNHSDESLIEKANIDLSYMYFLDINPEDSLPDKSLLSKFRTQRLTEISLDNILSSIVKQCVDKGIIKGTSISVDATHIEANTIKKTPERLMKHLGKKILTTYENETEKSLSHIQEPPNYQELENHHEAKTVMKDYLENVIEEVKSCTTNETTKTNEMINKAQEILSDPMFINQKGIRSLVDEDARVGHKSKTQNFYGYKTEFMMTTEERIITSVRTANGAYVDGTHVKEMLEQTKNNGINVKEVYGDKAYFRKSILEAIEALKATPYIPLSHSVYRIDESQFNYNKDSDEWICSKGNTTEKKKKYKIKNKNRVNGFQEGYKYYFKKEHCQVCSKRIECAKKSVRKILNIGINTNEFYDISQWQKTEVFKEKYKKRASIESKNAEVKRFHGLHRARGYGLLSVSYQSKLTAIAVNLKRIAGIIPVYSQ